MILTVVPNQDAFPKNHVMSPLNKSSQYKYRLFPISGKIIYVKYSHFGKNRKILWIKTVQLVSVALLWKVPQVNGLAYRKRYEGTRT